MVNELNYDLICYEGFYFLHVVLSAITLMIFIIICTIVSLNLFESSEMAHGAK